MSQADIEIAEVGYDNWNGGTELWTVFLRVPVSVFVSIETRRDEVAGIISKHLERKVSGAPFTRVWDSSKEASR
ncbi:hypothetical protein [uncultured Roseovarius sp.]|uniref:hypothetical protein n=1 Tax=uncultured Roseovarius sp. TaxID=293344 RepID=UPI002602132F|nr:hypothetical protein [uncultured Roseovarius sp.]